MSEKITNDEINELTDKAYAIIRKGLESTDDYAAMRTALDFVQMLTITAFNDRQRAVERWADELQDDRNDQNNQQPENQNKNND